MAAKIKRRSIMKSALIPMAAAVLLQFAAIYAVILSSGTLANVESNSIYVLSKSGENRVITLQNKMVGDWSEIGGGSKKISDNISKICSTNNLEPSELSKSTSVCNSLMARVSDNLLELIRQNGVNGAFFILTNGREHYYGDESMQFSGVYLRDSDPNSVSAENSDIILERGTAGIAERLNIPLDSFWTAKFNCDTDGYDGDFWRSYFNVCDIPEDTNIRNMGYWNPHACLYEGSKTDAVSFITYTVPVFADGRFVGVLGTEIQYGYLSSFFPAGDAGNISSSGYILMNYSDGEENPSCSIINTTGGIFKRIESSTGNIKLTKSQYPELMQIQPEDGSNQEIYAVLNDIKLYNSNTRFSNVKWSLTAVSTRDSLFGGIDGLIRNIILTSVFTLIASFMLVYWGARKTTRPITDMAKSLAAHENSTFIYLPASGIDEIDELSGTINNLSRHQQSIEAELREERERYLLAVESSTDVIIEYSLVSDTLRIYHVTGNEADSEMYFNSYSGFRQLILDGKICHHDDISSLIKLIEGKVNAQAVFRILRYPNNRYEFLWFVCRVKPVFDADGKLTKVIGCSKNITAEKEKELAAQDAVRRDTVTGLYNRDFGEKMADRYVWSANDASIPFSLCVIDVDDFNRIEGIYGMLFCEAVLSEVGSIIIANIGRNDVAFRIGGDEVAILFAGIMPLQAKDKLLPLRRKLSGIYAGEDTAELNVSIGISGYGDGKSYSALLECAMRALRFAKENRETNPAAIYSELKSDGVGIATAKFEPQHISTISKMIDSLSGNIVNFTFNIFEKTADVKSTINVMLPKIGRMFKLSMIYICETDLEYSTSGVSAQWCADGTRKLSAAVGKVDLAVYEKLQKKIGDDGTILIGGAEVIKMGREMSGIFRNPPENSLLLTCAIYEKGKYAGAIVFERDGSDAAFDAAEIDNLREIAKIFSTHISRSRSDLASRAKSEFLSRMSHEIRTPMNAIIGMTDIAKTVEDDPVKVNDCLEKIDISTKYLLSLINDILDMSRIESGKMHLEKGDFSLSAMLHDIDTLMRPQSDKKHINLVITSDIHDDTLTGDVFRINQVLINLMGNAVKFTPENGRIELRVTQKEQDKKNALVKFEVIDNGIGISPENCTKIFNAFEQAEDNTARRFGGTGLGLAISGSIVRMMGGKLEVESEPGKGSRFFFSAIMPIVDKPIESVKRESFTIADYQGFFTGKRALLVEDNELNTEIAQYILKVGGFTVENAENGRVAVDKFMKSEDNYYDVILMDIRMPVMDGLQATREIRRLSKSDAKTVPIIAMTANAFDDDMKKSIASGMNGHIAKPIDTPKLYGLLETVLK